MSKGGRRTHSGRKKTPTALKVIQGTFRPDRDGPLPTTEVQWPAPPSFLTLSEREAAIWAVLGEHHAWHAPSDWPAVWGEVRLIERLVRNHEAQRDTAAAGSPLSFRRVLGGEDGAVELLVPESNPLVEQEMKLFDKLRAFIAINGHSPVDRARMPKVGEVTAENPLEKLINRKRQ